MIRIDNARFPEDLTDIQAIFREYAESLDIDLGFQDFESELAGLPGKFAAPDGQILLARRANQVVGCVAVRPLSGDACEMKRLYVRPAGRGEQLGRKLAVSICQLAREAGYRLMRLDTLSTMTAALRVYESLGFARIPPYTFNPFPDAVFMECDLTRALQE